MEESRYLRRNPNSATRATWVARQYGATIPGDVLSYIQYLLEAPRRAAKVVRAIAVDQVQVFRARVARIRGEDNLVEQLIGHLDPRQPGVFAWMADTFPGYMQRSINRSMMAARRMPSTSYTPAPRAAATSYGINNAPITQAEIDYLRFGGL